MLKTVHEYPSYLYNNYTNKCLHFNHLTLLDHVSCEKMTNFVLLCITLVSFPEDGLLRTETSRNIKCDTI